MTFSDRLAKASADSKTLMDDIQAMINKRKKGDKTPASRKSLEPITRLRKDKEELIRVEETDPEIQFICDKLRDICGG